MRFFVFRFKLLATVPIAYPQTSGLIRVYLSKEEIASLVYHDIFEYPLTTAEVVRWVAGSKAPSVKNQAPGVSFKRGFYYLEGKEGFVLKRLMRKRISARKIEIAKKAARALSLIPSVKMVGMTGALAMENATDVSDIDLLIVTKKGTLWTTRLLVYFVLRIMNHGVRKPGDKNQKDKLCLNIWLDENDLAWHPKRRNLYTAHEIAQTVPLVNKDKTHEKFIWKNEWTRDYWPNAAKLKSYQATKLPSKKGSVARFLGSLVFSMLEPAAFKFQYQYMKSKITRETVTKTRALFHPVDWGKFVLGRLTSLS